MINVPVRLVRPDLQEAGRLAEIYRPYVEKTFITFEYTPPSPEEFLQRIQTIVSRYPYLVYEENGRILGYAYASIFRERVAYRYAAELSIYVDINHHGRHIGRSLYGSLLALLKRMGYFNAYACITIPNNRSRRFHEMMGFTYAGTFHRAGYKFDAWHDVSWMEKPLRDFSRAPGHRLTPATLGEAETAAIIQAQLDLPEDCYGDYEN